MLDRADKRHTKLLLNEAKEYLARGWSILPLQGKLPAVLSWKEFQARCPTTHEVTSWFSPSVIQPTGVAVVTGRLSNLVIVDCDTPADAEYWAVNFLETPLAAQTGRGGVHYYYAMPPDREVRNRAGVLRRRIDIRGEGGYAVAPPSLHPSGPRYAWHRFTDNLDLPYFEPTWIETPNPAPLNHPLPTSQQVRNAVAYIGRIFARSGEGGHNATFRAACKLRDAGLTPDEALSVLANWNETNASPPWSAQELQHKVESAYRPSR